jgi:predicted permease
MLARLVAYVRGIARRSSISAEVEDELRFHVEQEIETHVARGVTRVDAKRMTLRDLGGLTQTMEAVRDVRAIWLDLVWRDARQAVRSLRRSPIFAATAILTLAIGIGGSTAIFSIVNAVLLRPLPYHDSDRLVRIWESNPTEGNDQALVSAANFNDWRTRSRRFDDFALFNVVTEPIVLGVGDASLQVRQAVVTPNLFGLLGIRPAIGREFGLVPERRGPLDGGEIILSDGLWQRAFGADPAAIGRILRVEGVAGSVVVGVMPPGFSFPEGTDFWTPTDVTRVAAARRDVRMYGAIGRVTANVSVATARLDLQSIAEALARERPASNAQWTVAVLPLYESVVAGHRLALITLFAAVACVMLVGCANVSNLLLARGIARRGELAVRAALGASRATIARLLLAETVVLALIGGAAGLAFAGLLLPTLVQLAGDNVPRLADARLRSMTVAYSVAAAFLAAVVTGLIPALRHSRTDLQSALTVEGKRSTRLASDIRLQRVIVAGELAVSLVLLVGAMLFAQTFVRLNAVDLGFDPEHVISIETRVPIYRTLAPNRWQLLASDTSEALQRLRSVPGVQAVAAARDLPLDGNLLTTEITLPGEQRPRQAFYHRVTPEYFRTMGMTLVQGRDFTEKDISDLARLPDPKAALTAAPRQGALIVNETTARTFWPSGDAIGQFLSTSFDARPINRRQVVGIVRDARSETLRGGPPAEVYVPYLEDPSFAMTLLVRTILPTDQIVPIIRRELRDVTADMSTANIRMLDDVVGDSMRSSRFSASVMAAFAVAALLLSALGVFGMFAFGIATRVREVGIRMALGATGPDITRMFLKQAAGPITVGVALGTAGALALGRLVDSLLFGVAPTDAVSYAAAATMLVTVALMASYLPVRRVLQADPARALRG